MLKKVAAINDISGIGKCSLTAAIPILSVLGVQACPLPTAVLSSQTGFPSYFIDDYTSKMKSYIDEWHKLDLQFDGIHSGFLANASQVDIILDFISRFKQKNTIFLVDPVMGDDGEIYPAFNPSFCEKIKMLVSKADIITPNLTEACILTGKDFAQLTLSKEKSDYLSLIENLGQELLLQGPSRVVITGIRYQSETDPAEQIYNAVIEADNVYYTKSLAYDVSYSGTGDIFASVLCGFLVQGKSVHEAADKATRLIGLSVRDAYNENIDRNYGINFEKYLKEIL